MTNGKNHIGSNIDTRKNQPLGVQLAVDEANMMEAEKQDAPKRHLTQVKTPDHLPKKLHYTSRSRDEMSLKQEEIDKATIEEDMAIQNLYTTKANVDQDRLKCATELLIINGLKYKKVTRLEDEYVQRERERHRQSQKGASKKVVSANDSTQQTASTATKPGQTHHKLTSNWPSLGFERSSSIGRRKSTHMASPNGGQQMKTHRWEKNRNTTSSTTARSCSSPRFHCGTA